MRPLSKGKKAGQYRPPRTKKNVKNVKFHEPEDLTNPFNAGQLLGMLTAMMFIEKEGGIPDEVLQEVKQTCAKNLEGYFKQSAEEVLMIVSKIVKEMGEL